MFIYCIILRRYIHSCEKDHRNLLTDNNTKSLLHVGKFVKFKSCYQHIGDVTANNHVNSDSRPQRVDLSMNKRNTYQPVNMVLLLTDL
jgi:hypothetical protein